MTDDEIEQHYAAFLKALGQRIRDLRKARKLSLHDMVVKYGYYDSQWRRFERAGAANMLSVLKIARVFGITVSDLLKGLGTFPADGVDEGKKREPAKRTGAKATKDSAIQ